MKGDEKMTFNPSYAELLGKELQRNRMHEAERERLIRKAAAWNPSLSRKLSVIFRSYWDEFWSNEKRGSKYIPISHVPKKSPSL
ncbi:MAG: hypothetical protein E4H33_01530 [Anaerolineales bacterium]|nr:MAG: hypothetical protein E4H33_01530 [Anaerolineales bacterium]